MAEDKPKRFRFSLGFLLFWVLLSSFFLHKSFLHYERTQHIVNNVISSIVFVEQQIDQGWPGPVYHYTITSRDEGFFSTEPPDYVVSQNPTLKHEVNAAALSGNIGVCLALGLACCILCVWILHLLKRYWLKLPEVQHE